MTSRPGQMLKCVADKESVQQVSSMNLRLKGHRVRGKEKRRYSPPGATASSAICYRGTAWTRRGCWVFRAVGTEEECTVSFSKYSLALLKKSGPIP